MEDLLIVLGITVLIFCIAEPRLLVDPLLAVQKKLGFPRNVRTGSEALRGSVVTAHTPLSSTSDNVESSGKVRFRGEVWNARLESTTELRVESGQQLVIKEIQGLTVIVSPELEAAQDNRSKRASR